MENETFLRHINDLFRLSDKYCMPRFSEFLDGQRQNIVTAENFDGGMLWGGYDGAERRMLGIFPDWCEKNPKEFPISVLEFKKKYDKEISHRNYLGTILSLGIKREKIGDILTNEDGCYVFVSSDIADFVKSNIRKVSGCGVDILLADADKISIPEKKFELIETVAASLRLDAVVASATRKSRNDAKNMILSGRVCVNHCEMSKTDYILEDGDILSIRGFGRIRLEALGGKTGSNRQHITLKKYI